MDPLRREIKQIYKELDKNPTIEYLHKAKKQVEEICLNANNYEIAGKAKHLIERIDSILEEKPIEPITALCYMYEGLSKNEIKEINGHSIQELFQTIMREL